MNVKSLFEKVPVRVIALLLLALLGVVLMLRGNASDDEEKSTDSTQVELEAYGAYLEAKARDLCMGVAGVADVRVAVTFSGGFEQIYAADVAEKNGERVEEYVTVGSGTAARLTAVRTDPPKIAGIGIVCSGAESLAVRAELTALISSTFGVPTNKIYISSAA